MTELDDAGMDPMIEHLTPREHLLRADRAFAAAKASHQKYVKSGRDALSKATELADYLDLMQMVNTHANMATAKALLDLSERHTPVVFASGQREAFPPTSWPVGHPNHACVGCPH